MSSALRLSNLSAGYGELAVVRDLDLVVEEGEVVALLGPNGAGKSTTLWTVAGVLRPISGEVQLFGKPGWHRAPHEVARLGVSMVPEDRGLFHQLTVAENLRLRLGRRRVRRVSMEDILEHFPALAGLLDRRTGLLSGGEQQMLALGCALLSEPRLLMIDEMSLGLAPVIVERLLPIVRRIADERGMAVLLVEQHVQQALGIADRAYVLAHGRVVDSGPSGALAHRTELLEASYLGAAVRPI